MKTSMIKTMQWLLCTALLCVAEFASAQVASVFDVSGTVQAIPGAGAPRALRKGDSLTQGETIVTAEGASIVLRFEDGQVVALTSRSRFTISNYTYDRAAPEKSNVLLSLLEGGMRAVTGLIGKRNPASVNYKAANATIGIRGTDVTFATANGDVVVTVVDGAISFTFGGETVAIPAGQAALTQNGKVTTGTIAAINAAVAANPNLANALKSVAGDTLQKAVAEAAAKSAAEAKAAADKAAADAKANNQNTTGRPATGSGSTGAGGTGSGGGGKASGS